MCGGATTACPTKGQAFQRHCRPWASTEGRIALRRSAAASVHAWWAEAVWCQKDGKPLVQQQALNGSRRQRGRRAGRQAGRQACRQAARCTHPHNS